MNRRRTVVAASLAAFTLVGAACSSEKAQSTPSTTTVESTTTTVAGSTTVPTTTPETSAPTTAAPTTTPPTVPAYTLYQQVDGPDIPTGHTDPFAASGVLADGVYWVGYNGGEEMTPSITVYQAFFGDECVAKAAELGDECVNDYLVVGDPARDVDDLPFAADVYLTLADMTTQLSHWITPAELVVVRASSPSAGAPDSFAFVPFPFLMTVVDGEIVAFEQLWVP